MNFWIVGIDHELQLTKAGTDSVKLRGQKERLELILKEGVVKRQIDFISEESKLGKSTIAVELANANIPGIPWINIIMTDAQREAAGIADALKKPRPGHPDYETMTTWIECRIPEDEIREDFFIQQTLSEAQGADSVLVLVGDLHVDAVGEKLRQMDYSVATNHELFPVKRWE
jgi:hypothetical protein